MSVLIVDNITVGYGKRLILENQSIVFDKPEIISIIGPNGSGKSTFLKALARLIKIKQGTISLDDADLAAVEQAMKCTDVWKYRYRQIGELSGGERQRVWLSLSLAQEPNILLLDEPTTYLDSRHQIELMELVKRTQRERNIMVVMVLHDLNLALRYSDRIIALKEGAIVGDGTPHMMMTPENLAEWFGIKADILQSPRSEETCPICVPYGLA
ncbi:MAG: ABC transporter ATP-binding protein [Veillonella sp.]|nr:ABC transporter ATP-binding protein [Veillonella sp.]